MSAMDADFDLDILGQQPALNNIYTHLCLCFAVPDPASHSVIVEALRQGLERLTASFPWIAGQVVNEAAGAGNTGVYKVKPFESIPQLIVKDLRHDASMPTMADLRAARLPFRMLDEAVLGPRRTLFDSAADSFPVLLLQANFIEGGLLLDVLGEHGMMDIRGQDQIISLLSKACRNEPFTTDEIVSGNLSRRNIIPLLDNSYTPGPELDHQIVRPSPAAQSPEPSHPPRCAWHYFSIKPNSLKDIKSLAMDTKPHSTPYVTTNDSICAFIWRAVIRARSPRLSPAMKTMFARAVDVRRYLNIPQEYPGLVQNMTYSTYTIQQLLEDETLGSIASQFRAAVDPETSDIAFRTRAMATFLERSLDKNTISLTATLDLSTNILLSSWASLECHKKDFGPVLGRPEAVRLPRFFPVESMFYLLTETVENGGGLLAGLCLRDEDLARLRMDEEWNTNMEYIG